MINEQYNCSKLTSITIPDSVTSIGDGAFRDCTSLTSITIPDSVTSIGSSAFSGCTSLTSITIPDSVTSIGSWAFSSCTSLTNVTIPDSVMIIGSRAFSGCTSLTNITVNSANEYYCSENGVLFVKDRTALICYPSSKVGTTYSIPDSVTSIGDGAFYGCTSLTSITIPNSVTSIGDGAFYKCTSLTSITVPDSVTSIGSGAFDDTGYYNNSSNWENNVLYNGHRLIVAKTSINGDYEIKPGTKMIVDSAFANCKWITSIIIPESLTSIGNHAFVSCTSLTSITIPDGVTSIGEEAFSWCSKLTSVIIPDSVTSIGWRAFLRCTSLTSITIPDSVTSIGYEAFYYCTSLASVDIGTSVTSIGYAAFFGCTSLTSITIPDSVTSIGSSAFEECTSLTSVTIPANVSNIGKDAFSNCQELVIYGFSGTEAEKYAKAIELTFVPCDILPKNHNTIIIDNFIFTNNSSLLELTDFILLSPIDSSTVATKATKFFGTNSTIKIGGSEMNQYTVIVKGDIDGDGVSDVLDLVMAERAANNKAELTKAQAYAANGDINEDVTIETYQNLVNAVVAA